MAKFNAYEVFEIAEQIERNGYAFYSKAASMVEDEESRQFLLRMAAMEEEHEGTFGKLKEEFALHGDTEFPDVDEQTLAYLRAVASGNVFVASNNQQSIIKGNESVVDLIRLAISFEKDSVIYFSTVKELVKDPEDKKKIEALAQEEVTHIAMLVEELNRINR